MWVGDNIAAEIWNDIDGKKTWEKILLKTHAKTTHFPLLIYKKLFLSLANKLRKEKLVVDN
jgi:hypothetical protein